MSLLRLVVRRIAVAAMRSQTMAEERVYDSDNTPLVEALKNSPAKPYIVVYTDEDVKTDITGREVYSSHRALSLVLELGVASAVQVVQDGEWKLDFPQTDEGMEAAVDVLEAQAMNALLGNPRSEWGELFKRFAMVIQRVPSRRGGSAQAGQRWAARQVQIVCEMVSDLPIGVPIPADHPINKFMEMAEGSDVPDMGAAANIINAVMHTEQFNDREQAKAWLGLTSDGMDATGLAPWLKQDRDEEQPAPPIGPNDGDIDPAGLPWPDTKEGQDAIDNPTAG